MNVFKKLYLTTFSSFESVVNRIQNHDALIGVSLKELDTRIREAQMAFGALTRSLQKTADDSQKADAEIELWTSRAKREGLEGRKEPALECLRRAEQAKRTKEALAKQHERSEVSHRTLQSRIIELQNLQKTLTLRHRELKARSQVQDANSVTASISEQDVSEMLNRWEDSLGISVATEPSADSFESTFTEAEERNALELQLNELLR